MAQEKRKWLVYKVTKQIYDDHRVVITANKESGVYRYGVSKKQVIARYQYTTQYFGSSCEGPGYYRETYIDAEEIVESTPTQEETKKEEIKKDTVFGEQISVFDYLNGDIKI